jgi:hypothetical protein
MPKVQSVQTALELIWSDEALKRRLLSEPRPVLTEFGMEIPESVSIQIHENTPTLINAILLMKPIGSADSSDPVTRIMVRAREDATFKARLLSNPKETVAEAGLRLPATIELRVWEETPTLWHIVLPVNPSQSELSDFDLEAVAGGSSKGGTAACVLATPGLYIAVGSTGGVYSPSAAANTSSSISSGGK